MTKVDGSITFLVRVSPGSSRSNVGGNYDGALKVAVHARAVGGAANQALVEVIAKAFGCRRRHVEIMSGHASRMKRVRIVGDAVELDKSLTRLLSS